MTINWNDLTQGYNHRFGGNFTIKKMVIDCYERSIKKDKKSGHRAAEVLGIDSQCFYKKLIEFGIKRQNRGGRTDDTTLEKIRAIPDEEIMFMRDLDIAEMVGCVSNHISLIRRENPDEEKLKLNICRECGRKGGRRITECFLFLEREIARTCK